MLAPTEGAGVPHAKQLIMPLVLLLLTMAVGMTAFEIIKSVTNPTLTLWQSHTITIVVSALMATSVGCLILRKWQSITSLLVAETAEKARVSEALLKAEGEKALIARDAAAAAAVVNQNLANEISERKRTEEAIRESEERFRVLFESSHDAITITEPPLWKFTAGNPATVKMFRMKNVEEFISYAPGDLSPERQPDGRASAEKAKEMNDTALREGSHFFEWTHKRADGEEFPTTVLLTRMEYAGKTVIQSTIRDVTRQKRAEERLNRERENLKAIFEAAPVGMLLMDENLVVTAVNGVAARMVGKTAAELVGVQPGDAMGCMHATESPGGCGSSPSCPACRVRAALEGVLKSDKAVRGLEVRADLSGW